jgi:hypothetical protein
VTDEREQPAEPAAPRPHEVRLPGFVGDEAIGLGDALKRVTSAVGVKPCGPCAQRAQRLNQWMVFRGRRT